MEYLQADLRSAGLAEETAGALLLFFQGPDTIQAPADRGAVFIKGAGRAVLDNLGLEGWDDVIRGEPEPGREDGEVATVLPGGGQLPHRGELIGHGISLLMPPPSVRG